MRVVAADWSGAARAERRHLWVAEIDVDAHRVSALAGCSRQDAGDRMLEIVGAGGRDGVIIGLDFGFSLPEWFLDREGIAAPAELWRDTERLEAWLRTCPDPFWGRPGRGRPPRPPEEHFRRTELATTPRPRSVFQIGGAGAVGTASLRGMPLLDRLQRAGCSIWPFDPPSGPLVLEVWPRLAIGDLVKSRRSERARWLSGVDRRWSLPTDLSARAEACDDAFDALAAALHLAARLPAPPEVTDATLRREGWIWGVPLPSTAAGACGTMAR